MSTVPSECPLCGAPVRPERPSHTDTGLVPAMCSEAPTCPWENRWPYICVYCGGHRLVDVESPHLRGRKVVILLGTVCNCGSSSMV
jgi:hypothetical protein